MATIYELAQMSDDAYNGTSYPTPSNAMQSRLLAGLDSSDWEVFTTSTSQDPLDWSQGYFGVAYYNTVTQEVVIANRGTDKDNGANTLLKNVFSDIQLADDKDIAVESDAAAFAQYVINQLNSNHISFTDIIETGHSLGGSEAQAALVSLVDTGLVSNADISAVVFNSPGIGSYTVHNAPSSYNVVDFYTQGDYIHDAGGTHLGGANNMIMLAAGPDTSALFTGKPDFVYASPIYDGILLGEALHDVAGPAHSIDTILSYIEPGAAGSSVGQFNWTSSSSASSITGSPTNSALPSYSVDANDDLVVNDPSTGITVTLSLSADGQSLVATYSGGGSAFAQALSSLGAMTVPLDELSQSLGSLSGSALIAETVARN